MHIATNLFPPMMLLAFASPLLATPVRHTIDRHESIYSTQTLGVCVSMVATSDHNCNPAMIELVPQRGFNMEINLKAEEKGYETTRDLLYEQFDKSDVEKLFAEQDFMSYSGNARLEAAYSKVVFSYIPAHAILATKISNPSLPELSVSAMKQSVLGLKAARKFQLLLPWSKQIVIGIDAYRYDRELTFVDANIVEFSVSSADELAGKEREIDSDWDAGFVIPSDDTLVPSIGLVGRNLAHSGPDKERPLGITYRLRRSISAGASWLYVTDTGEYSIGVSSIYRGETLRMDRDESAVAFSYRIGGLQSFVAMSPISRGFGFMFIHTVYIVGIKYSNEKQENPLQLQRKNHVYLFTKIFL
jgi:hypothetical protein